MRRHDRDNPLLHLDFEAQIDQLRKFTWVCRDNDIELTVALSPLRPIVAEQLDEDGTTEAIRRIAEIVPVWDFGHPRWLSDSSQLWLDDSHFTAEVWRIMLDRVFGGERPLEHPDFGELKK